MSTTEKYIGESKIINEPQKKVVFKIADGSVTTSKIADGAVTAKKIAENTITVNNLGEEVQLAIQSIERAGIALAQTLGQSEVMGISQKAITDEFASLEGSYYSN